MNSGGLLLALHGRGRGLRLASSGVTVLLLISLLISLQPCCALFTSLFTQHGHDSTILSEGIDHRHGSSNPVSENDQNYCGDGASASTYLAKAIPAIPDNLLSSHDVDVFAASPLPVFATVSHLVLSSAYHPSPPPYRLYLRFLHLLI